VVEQVSEYSVRVRHLFAVPQPDDTTVGSLLLTEEQAHEFSASAVDELLADIGVETTIADTRAVLEATWLAGALWGIERCRERIEAMT
jgi:hypothetical protein